MAFLAPIIASQLATPAMDFIENFKEDVDAGNSIKNSAKDAGIQTLADTARTLTKFLPDEFEKKLGGKIDFIEQTARKKYITTPIIRPGANNQGGARLTQAGIDMLAKVSPRFKQGFEFEKDVGITGNKTFQDPDTSGSIEFNRFSRGKPLPKVPDHNKPLPKIPKRKDNIISDHDVDSMVDFRRKRHDRPDKQKSKRENLFFDDKIDIIENPRKVKKPIPTPRRRNIQNEENIIFNAPASQQDEPKRKVGRPKGSGKKKDDDSLKRGRSVGSRGVGVKKRSRKN